MDLNRDLMNNLVKWKNRPSRKPLLVNGARQTGKTWLSQEFGRREFRNTVRLDFMADEKAKDIFNGNLDPRRIIKVLAIANGIDITPSDTLIIFDEVQECPRALTSLKYFCEDAPEFHVLSTGSFMGIAGHEGTSFPVGKVDMLRLEPLSFLEYLHNVGEPMLAQAIRDGEMELLGTAFNEKATEYLREYMFVGGMPDVVSEYLTNHDLNEARRIQHTILDSYDKDFSKHATPVIQERLRQTWNSLPAQLARENRRFVYSLIREGARAREYEICLQWLADYAIMHKVPCLTVIRKPLSAYVDSPVFKVFGLDVGLVAAMSDVDARAIVDGDKLFTEFKGALTEQYVCQQLLAQGLQPYYWANPNPNGKAEVDFVVSVNGRILPIEVKSERNLNAKSLRYARDRFKLEKSVRTSLAGYRDEGWVLNLPLWAIGALSSLDLDFGHVG
jgi:predicted AAA+ superfamily ATPase